MEGNPDCRARFGGTIDSQIGEEILLEIVRFRHFGEILYLVVKLVVTTELYATPLHSSEGCLLVACQV
jgi:hypothetical protein